MSSVYDLFQPSMQGTLRAAAAKKQSVCPLRVPRPRSGGSNWTDGFVGEESVPDISASSTLTGSEEPGGSPENKEAPPVLTADGRSFALVGTNVNDIDVHAMKDFKEAQEEEIRNCESSLRIASLETFQRCGHVSDVAKQIVRCPLCPFHKVNV